jgi:glycerate kinase
LTVLCCPDSLKGVLPARAAAAALAVGVRRGGLAARELPLGDGGEGTADALAAALGGQWRTAEVHDPLGRLVTARFLRLPDARAVVESAEAIGLWRLSPDELDPHRASSYGLGELMRAAVEDGAREIIVTLGGSATVDGGAGLREALGGTFPKGVRLRAVCDVTNPLLGERGAARVFGPQKGARPDDVEELERRLAAMEELAPYRDLPGAGAAGGLGAALVALGASLEQGSQLVLETVDLAGQVARSTFVITGEGTVDETSSQGKLPGAVAQVCREQSKPCVVFGGLVRGGVPALYDLGATAVLSLSGDPAEAEADLTALGEALARLVVAVRREPSPAY